LTTYSQIASKRAINKREFLLKYGYDSILILDESHNASGLSNTGEFMRDLLGQSKGVIYLSATYAKRPDNMPIYAMKTAMQDAAMSHTELIDGIKKGGVALQEILSSQLAGEGQLIRRERSFSDTEIVYMTLDESQDEINPKYNLKEVHRAIYDKSTEIIRDIIEFQRIYVKSALDDINSELRQQHGSADLTAGTQSAGVAMPPEFSGVFNLVNQLLFSIKAKAVAEIAIDEIKKGRKPLIAFSSTMESFLDSLEADDGGELIDGDIVPCDFSSVFLRRLDRVRSYSVRSMSGKMTKSVLPISSLSIDGQLAYEAIKNKIKQLSLGINISPIDVIIDTIKKAGFSVEEITGRKRALEIIDEKTAKIYTRTRKPNQDIIRAFQDNEVDCILLNQSGSTGISAHAVPTDKVPKEQVKPRTMIALQFELNINTEIQKRGRIFHQRYQLK
jgi:hypothetical protein